MSQNHSPLSLDNPAAYRICVKGTLDSGWLAMLSGEWTLAEEPTAQLDTTVLVGQVRDQAALVGTLEQLYSLGLPLLSIACLASGVLHDGRGPNPAL
jgi:hypothetical protein